MLRLACRSSTASRLILAACWAAIMLPGPACANEVDDLLQIAHQRDDVQAEGRCSETQFLRRLSLDLIGRIPSPEERTAFAASPDRARKVEELLASDEHARFWSELWTTSLYGFGDQYGSDREMLRQWLEEQFRTNRPYHETAIELLSAEGSAAFVGPVNFLIRHQDEPIVKVSRMFLGVRLDCARCHDHPFDRWTQDDFMRMKRFFETVSLEESSPGVQRVRDEPGEASDDDRPRFLTGAVPRTRRWRSEFALFATRSKPFARNHANRVWYLLMGRGLVDPPDDFSEANPPAAPELLEGLAARLRSTGFDTRDLVRMICNSNAYQRPTAAGAPSRARELFAVRELKPLTPQQLFDSLRVAVDLPDEGRDDFVETMVGSSLDADFSELWRPRDTVQTLMNRLVDVPPVSEGDVEALYERILLRPPTDRERQACQGRPLADVAYALVHSHEFCFNH